MKRIVRQFSGLCFFCSFVVVALEKNIFDKLLSIRCKSLLVTIFVMFHGCGMGHPVIPHLRTVPTN